MRELAAGATLGPYRIEETLGRGAMGVVYRGVDAEGTRVALKVLSPEAAQDAIYVERFRRELDAVSRVRHPHVARCFGFFEDRGLLALALEYVPGGTLADLIRREGPRSWHEAARLGAQTARALAAIHHAGLVHRDLKPANVLLDAQGNVKLADFGIARRSVAGQSLTRTAEVLGTPEYMAPEQMGAAKEVDARADLYSLGATLFCLLAGTPPFTGDFLTIATAVSRTTAPRVRSRNPSVPASLDELIARLLSTAREGRPASALEVARELDAIGESRGASRGLQAVALVLVVAAVSVLGLAIATKGRKAEAPPEASPSPTPPAPAPSAPPAPPRPEVPAWYLALPEAKRPSRPLPPGIAFGSAPGEYVAVKDPTIAFVFVPGGTFVMGDDDTVGEDEKPAHEVELSPFFFGKHEVTNAQFRRWLVTGGGRLFPPAVYRDGWERRDHVTVAFVKPFPGANGGPIGDDHPIVQITPFDADAYAEWLGLSLPTEAQWERAARWEPAHPDRRYRFPWGDEVPSASLLRVSNLIDTSYHALDKSAAPRFLGYDDGYPRTAPVGKFPRDCAPCGALDVMGNVSEICQDRYDARVYASARGRDPVVPRPQFPAYHERVIRGANWRQHQAWAGLTTRDHFASNNASNAVGIRLAVTHR